MVINRVKFDVCTPSSFGGVRAYVHTNVRADRMRFIQFAYSQNISEAAASLRLKIFAYVNTHRNKLKSGLH